MPAFSMATALGSQGLGLFTCFAVILRFKVDVASRALSGLRVFIPIEQSQMDAVAAEKLARAKQLKDKPREAKRLGLQAVEQSNLQLYTRELTAEELSKALYFREFQTMCQLSAAALFATVFSSTWRCFRDEEPRTDWLSLILLSVIALACKAERSRLRGQSDEMSLLLKIGAGALLVALLSLGYLGFDDAGLLELDTHGSTSAAANRTLLSIKSWSSEAFALNGSDALGLGEAIAALDEARAVGWFVPLSHVAGAFGCAAWAMLTFLPAHRFGRLYHHLVRRKGIGYTKPQPWRTRQLLRLSFYLPALLCLAWYQPFRWTLVMYLEWCSDGSYDRARVALALSLSMLRLRLAKVHVQTHCLRSITRLIDGEKDASERKAMDVMDLGYINMRAKGLPRFVVYDAVQYIGPALSSVAAATLLWRRGDVDLGVCTAAHALLGTADEGAALAASASKHHALLSAQEGSQMFALQFWWMNVTWFGYTFFWHLIAIQPPSEPNAKEKKK